MKGDARWTGRTRGSRWDVGKRLLEWLGRLHVLKKLLVATNNVPHLTTNRAFGLWLDLQDRCVIRVAVLDGGNGRSVDLSCHRQAAMNLETPHRGTGLFIAFAVHFAEEELLFFERLLNGGDLLVRPRSRAKE